MSTFYQNNIVIKYELPLTYYKVDSIFSFQFIYIK